MQDLIADTRRDQTVADEAREGISAIEEQIAEQYGKSVELQWFHGKPLHQITQSTPTVPLRATQQGKSIFVEFTLEQLADHASDDHTQQKVRSLLRQLAAG